MVASGTSPMAAWEHYHGHAETLSGMQVLGLASGLWPTDMPLDHANRLVRGVTPEQLWRLWRAWHQGQRVWREPGYETVPSREAGRASEVARAHRALCLLLGALEAGMVVLPSPCASCGCPSALRCRRCDSPICLDAYIAPGTWVSSSFAPGRFMTGAVHRNRGCSGR